MCKSKSVYVYDSKGKVYRVYGTSKILMQMDTAANVEPPFFKASFVDFYPSGGDAVLTTNGLLYLPEGTYSS